MGYWSNQPMAGDFPEDIQQVFREGILNSLNNELLQKFNDDSQEFEVGKSYKLSEIEIDDYEKNIDEFKNWLQGQCLTNEKVIIKEICDTIMFANKEEGFYGADLNDVCFIIPLSFLEWEIKLRPKSELSQYLLTLLKGTDGGSKDRGYIEQENIYPNGINTPSDFIKAYIEHWNDLIIGKMNIGDIEPTQKTQRLGENLYNTR